MRKILFLICFLLVCCAVSAQTVKTYSGSMSKLPVTPVGFGFSYFINNDNWTYQYYENEGGDRVYHGILKHTHKFGANGTYTIKGQYSNGKREGQWEYKIVRDIKEIAKFIVNYHNDLFEGNFDYFVAHGKNEVTRMNGKFQTGHLIGEVNYSDVGFGYSYNYKLNYLDGGYPVGTWTFNENARIDYDHEMRFINGFLVYLFSIDQSTGERKIGKVEDVDLGNYKGHGGAHVLVAESMAKNLSQHNRKFKGLNDYYEVLEGGMNDIEYTVFSELGPNGEKALERVHSIYKDIGYEPRYMKIDWDKERNKEVSDSIAKAKRQQEEQARIEDENAKRQKKLEVQQAKEQLDAKLKEIELKINQTIALRKNAQKWVNLNRTFRAVSKDQPNDKNWVLQFYTCVYRILNSEIDNNSRESYEQKISAEATKASDGINRAGGWMCYCDYKKLLNDCIELSKGLNLVDTNSIPEFSDAEISKYQKILQKRQRYGFY